MTDIEVIAQYTPQQLRETADRLLQKAAERQESGKGGYGGHALMIACLRFCADAMEDSLTDDE